MLGGIESSRTFQYWRLFFYVAGAVLVINVLVAFYSVALISSNYDYMSRAMQMAMAVRASYSGIQDVEISERIYLVRGDEAASRVYRDAVGDVMRQMKLMEQTDSLPRLQPLVQELKALLLRRLNADPATQVIQDDEVTVADGSQSAMATTRLMQEIRRLVEEIEAAYQKQVQARGERIRSGQTAVNTALAIVTGLGIASIILMYRLFQRAMVDRRRWEQDQMQREQELESRVAERTADLQLYSRDLQRSNRELEDFAFVASHDLQEPLRKILAFGDRLQRKHGEALGDGVDYLERMQAAARRMSTLINDLLEFSRVSSKPLEKVETLSLDAVLADVLDDLEEVIKSRGALINADPLPDIEADATQMRQLLQNLVGNAIKFVDAQQTPAIRVTSRILPARVLDEATIATEALELQVIDNGIGFDEEYLERIFKPFQRLHSRTQYSGTGIGLAVCQRIVERHGGILSARSERGKGSVFTVNLPLTQTLSDDADGITGPLG